MELYHIPEYVHTCIASERIIFLDSKRDQYFFLDIKSSKILKKYIHNQSIRIDRKNTDHKTTKYVEEIIDNLLSENLLETSEKKQSPPKYNEYNTPKYDLSETDIISSYKITINNILLFTLSWISANILFRLFGFHRSTQYVKNFKPRILRKHMNLEYLINVFRLLRPVFYTSKDNCYFDCMVLTLFLKYHGFDARWIIGVSMEPFKAHCWTQVETTVVSDYLSAIILFTPIMKI